MTTVGWLPAPVEELFGTDATAEESYEVLTVDVPPSSWLTALGTARDRLTCTYFDWLSAVDEPGTGFRVTAHVVALSPVRRLLLRTTVPHEAPALPSAVGVYAGAAWHERETHEMFGVDFKGHPALDHLLLPETFEGHPLRKDFVLAARVAKAWPGAKEPGESDHGGPKRRQMLPPGVPDPNEWGPLKGQLPPAPTRPTRAPARAAGERPVRAAGERPARRTRSVAEGSASQVGGAAGTGGTAGTGGAVGAGAGPASAAASAGDAASENAAASTRDAASENAAGPVGGAASASAAGSVGGAASDAAAAGAPGGRPRRARSAAEGSVSQTAADVSEPAPGTAEPSAPGAPVARRRARSASEGSASQRGSRAEQGTPADQGDRDERDERDERDDRDGESEAAAGGGAAAPRATGSPSPKPSKAPRSMDAPWHHARPAFDEPDSTERPSPDDSTSDDSTPDTRSPEDPEGGRQ
ncbi:NADH-quinone oxidoreductase subunit C [Streptomyces sp. NPDC002766]|uniref:NADH-quinone oxidoreductase subunit C n=1 Tax=Streptomyces sp. NPDC002766 TaxID=3154429 RepID=UPI003317A728